MGLSNSEFATLIGCHVTTASRYRNGHRLPNVQLLESIRTALGLSWEEIHAKWQEGQEWAAKHPKARYPDRSKNPFGVFLREHVFADDAEPVSA